MNMHRRQFAALASACGVSLLLPGMARSAQVTKMIVGFAPGGTADMMARAIAEAMRSSGYTVIVENRPGAGGRIATEALLAAPADGNTLLLTPSTNLTLFPHVYANTRYSLDDVVPVGDVSEVQFGLAVASRGPRNLQEFLQRAKSDRRNSMYGTPGAGSVMDLLGAMLARQSKVPLISVPYKGGAAALTDVVGGSVPAVLSAVPNLMPMYKAGKLRILAVTSEEPLPAFPDVPTFKSAGFPGLTASEYMCVVARRGVPAPVLEKLTAAVAAAGKAPQTLALMRRLGFEPAITTTPDALTKRLAADSARWQAEVRQTGFRPNQ
jgi:tripartite-type tricarboxylate transporter receptor subunit TctC